MKLTTILHTLNTIPEFHSPEWETNRTWYFDPINKAVSEGPALPFETSDHCIVGPLGAQRDEYLLVAGYANPANELDAVLYNELSGTWTYKAKRNETRRRMSCTKIKDDSGQDFVLVAGNCAANSSDLQIDIFLSRRHNWRKHWSAIS